MSSVTDKYEKLEDLDNSRGRNDRFAYSKVMRDGKEFFLKRARSDDPELRDGLMRERVWSDFMLHVKDHYPKAKLEGPVVKELTEDGIVMEFVDAPHLAEGRDLHSWIENLDRYAQMLVVLDRAADGYETTGVDYSCHRTEQAFAVWDRWLGPFKSQVARLGEAKMLVNDYAKNITTRMQHGDLTPWQIFDDKGTWIIYDGEKCGTDLARYNDLAYGYGRLATLLRSPETAARLLRIFIEQSGEDIEGFTNQFIPVMVGRSIGMLSDALHDQRADDYGEYAEVLLDKALSGDISRLLDT